MGTPSQSYGTSLAIWDHTVLPATRHERAPPNPSHAGRYSIYLPRRDGKLSWLSCLDSAPADLLITSPTPNRGRRVRALRNIRQVIMEKKLNLFGHICRMSNGRLIKKVVFGIMDGTPWRGRPSREWLDDIQDWCGAFVCMTSVNMLAQSDKSK